MTPLVQGGYRKTSYPAALFAHTLGAVVAGVGFGLLLGFIGTSAVPRTPEEVRGVAVGVLGLVGGLGQLSVLPLRAPQVPRQTVKQWRELLGPVGAPLAWGIDLGSGLTTYVVHAGYWVLPLAALLQGSVLYGGLILGLFGLGRALTVVIASLAARESAAVPIIGDDSPFGCVLTGLSRHTARFRRHHAYGVILVSLGLMLGVAV
jgi:hypothetical protein